LQVAVVVLVVAAVDGVIAVPSRYRSGGSPQQRRHTRDAGRHVSRHLQPLLLAHHATRGLQGPHCGGGVDAAKAPAQQSQLVRGQDGTSGVSGAEGVQLQDRICWGRYVHSRR
jgi:hypothetical protein